MIRKLLATGALALVLCGCEELVNSTDEACSLIVGGCALLTVQDYEYCSSAINDPLATPDELARLCDAFYRGEMCQCVTPVCVRDVIYGAPLDYDSWTRDFVNKLHCPASILRPYEEVK